jgi:protease I
MTLTTMSPDHPQAVIITGPGFQDEEVVYPYYRLQEAECSVDMATKDGVLVHGKYGVPAKATLSTSNLDPDRFDLVVLPGGFEAPDRVRLDQAVLQFLREMDKRNKLIGAICHGPWILISAGLVRGRRMTGYQSIADDIRNAGADYVDAPVVVDRNLVTSAHYRDNGIFMRTLLEQLTLQINGRTS